MSKTVQQTSAISVVINTKNAASTLEKALQSVADWAAEIVVVDMKSSDHTRDIAKRFTKHVFEYAEDLGYADPARNFALSKASCEWILVLDADEQVPASLAEHLSQLVKEPSDTVCWFLPRQNYIFGKWLEHTGWWPDYQPRLFKKGTVSWQVGVHRLPDISGRSEQLPAQSEYALRHENYPTVTSYLQRLDRYTTLAAQETSSTEKNAATTSARLFNHFSQEFFTRLFAHRGIADGAQGVSLSLLQGTYELSTALKVWEKNGFAQSSSSGSRKDQLELIEALYTFRKDMAYWLADYQVKQSSGVTQLWWKIRRKLKI